jgi:hypothetical protein
VQVRVLVLQGWRAQALSLLLATRHLARGRGQEVRRALQPRGLGSPTSLLRFVAPLVCRCLSLCCEGRVLPHRVPVAQAQALAQVLPAQGPVGRSYQAQCHEPAALAPLCC